MRSQLKKAEGWLPDRESKIALSCSKMTSKVQKENIQVVQCDVSDCKNENNTSFPS